MNTPTLHGATTKSSAGAASAERLSNWRPPPGSYVGFFAAACWIALGVESILRPQQENYRDLLWMIPFGLTAITFIFVHAVQRSAVRFERIGFYLMIASVLAFVGSVGLLTDQPSLAAFGFPWGAAGWAAGLIVYGIGTWTCCRSIPPSPSSCSSPGQF